LARNGSGAYSLPAGNPVVTGTVISSSTMNTTLSDIATALTASIANDGQTVPVANIPMGGFKLTGLGAATVNGDAVRYQEAVLAGADAKITSMTALTAPTVAANPVRATDLQVQLVTAFTTGGTSTAYTLTPTPAITANTTNQRFRVKFNAASGATPTLAVSGQTAKNLKYYDSTGTKQAITSTQVPINWISDVEYDGTDWLVMQPADMAHTASVQSFTAAQRGAVVPLTDAATITPDFSLGNNFAVSPSLGGNRTLANPTNLVAGQSGMIYLPQDGTGSRTLTLGWGWPDAGVTLSTVAGTVDALAYYVAAYASATVTISNATPGVVTWSSHGLLNGQKIQLTTTGGLPTGLSPSTTYYVKYVDANTFQLSSTIGGASINTSSAGSGVHTCTAVTIQASLTKGVM